MLSAWNGQEKAILGTMAEHVIPWWWLLGGAAESIGGPTVQILFRRVLLELVWCRRAQLDSIDDDLMISRNQSALLLALLLFLPACSLVSLA
mmetsp:Transcript_41289/g.162784  ORF Transcript_41289/g.162784 Transcript_41289/m.162784 type:complete len:92 (+) Transcript_41289:108-383(+)